MKCPLHKRTFYTSGRNTGSGYPSEWIAVEEFEDCIEKDCALFYTIKEYSNIESDYIQVKRCGLQRKFRHD